MHPNLSIIIPIYNVERFLDKCLSSIVSNNFQDFTYEVIIVDDESPDSSIDIAEKYASKYENFTIVRQINKGLGGARNTGIDKADGEYVFFLDSDDFLINNKLVAVLLTALSNKLDIIEFGAERVDNNYRHIDVIFQKQDSEILDGLSYVQKNNFENSACNKLYRRQFLTENKIEFFERTYIEDAPFNTEALSKAIRVQSSSEIPVAFFQNASSITRQKRTGETLKKFIEDSLKVTSRMNQIANRVNVEESKKIFQKKVAVFTTGTLFMILRSNLSLVQKQNYIQELKKNNLYPVPSWSGIFIRDVFLLITNRPLVLKLLLRFMK